MRVFHSEAKAVFNVLYYKRGEIFCFVGDGSSKYKNGYPYQLRPCLYTAKYLFYLIRYNHKYILKLARFCLAFSALFRAS